MNVEDLKELKWIPVKRKIWKTLTATYSKRYKNEFGSYSLEFFVGKEDLDRFEKKIIEDISRKLNVSVGLVSEIFKEENYEYYTIKEVFFNTYSALNRHSFNCSKLKRLLKIPDINSIKEDLSHSGIESVLNSFNELSDADKIEVLKELKLISVKVEVERLS